MHITTVNWYVKKMKLSADKSNLKESTGINHMDATNQNNQPARSDLTRQNPKKRNEQWMTQTTQWISGRNEDLQTLPDGCRAFIVSLLFLALGFITLWFMRAMLNMQQEAVLVAILFVPVLVYLILSGTLQEISAGGVSAKFNNAARKPLFTDDSSNIMSMNTEEVAFIMKRGLEELQAELQAASNSKYIILTVTLGEGTYVSYDLLVYLKALSQYRNFTFLAILEQNEKIFGYITGWQTIQIIELEEEMKRRNIAINEDFVQAINMGRKSALTRYGLVKETVKTTDTTIAALKKLTDLNTNVLIVTDENDTLKGIVEREQVLGKLMLTLTK